MERNTVYAHALLAMLEAEGAVEESSDELFRFARVLESNDDLLATLGDPRIPAERRTQVVEDLLEGRASPPTVAALSYLVIAGRTRDIPAIVGQLVEEGARSQRRRVAEVRTAVDLTDEQRQRLAASLSEATGLDLDVKVVVDPSVIGGVLAQVGDHVFDGTVRSRLRELRQSF